MDSSNNEIEPKLFDLHPDLQSEINHHSFESKDEDLPQLDKSWQPQIIKMSFSDAIRICLKEKYATFKGRASRLEYTCFFIFEFVIVALTGLQYAFLGSDKFLGSMATRLQLLCCYGLCIPLFAVTVRRLHDIGKSGMLALLTFSPGIGFFISVFLLMAESQKSDNDYGPYVEVKKK